MREHAAIWKLDEADVADKVGGLSRVGFNYLKDRAGN